MKDLAFVPTGVANIASVAAAFRRLGCSLQPVTDAASIRRAPALLLPGVGQFGAAAAALAAAGVGKAVAERVRCGAPTLGICLGMQLLFTASDEAPGTAGLCAVEGVLQRFPAGVRCPQMGWNRVVAPADARFLRDGDAYFANGYRLPACPSGWLAATADHGGQFMAALERGSVLLCQFHPELSARYGEDLLARWLLTAGDAPC